MRRLKNAVPFLLFVACAPDNAQLTSGRYVAFLSDGTSLSLAKGTVDPEDDAYLYSYNVDCRPPDSASRRERLPDNITCGPLRDIKHEIWTQQSGFRVVSEDLAPWRGEALITDEGDMQIGFHHRVGGRGDFRFIMAVHPDFQPTECTVGADGTVERTPYDGDWIDEWSRELETIAALPDRERVAYAHLEPYLDGGRLYFLNGAGYQFNPGSGASAWFLPDQWEAGNSRGRFVDEGMLQRSSVWGDPGRYFADADDFLDQTDFRSDWLWYCQMPDGTEPTDDSRCQSGAYSTFGELAAHVDEALAETAAELDRALTPSTQNAPILNYRPITHMNRWRTTDGLAPGLDGWAGMHYSYVVFSEDSVLEPGGHAEGAFSLRLESFESVSEVFVTGQFVIDDIKVDRWGAGDIRGDKAEEAGVDLCFQQ